jgi:hypothetical protein
VFYNPRARRMGEINPKREVEMIYKRLVALVVVVAAAFFATSASATTQVPLFPIYNCTTNNSVLVEAQPELIVTIKGVMAGCIRGTLTISAIAYFDGVEVWAGPTITCQNSTSCSLPTSTVTLPTCGCHGIVDVIVYGQHEQTQDEAKKHWTI